MTMSISRPAKLAVATVAVCVLAAPIAAAADSDDDSYAYLRVVDGEATLLQQDGRVEAEENYPVLTGDRVDTTHGGKAEIVLPDRNVVRVGQNTSIDLERLAYSSDSDARTTRLYVDRGEMQLVVREESFGDEFPRIDTPNASVYVRTAGAYLLHVSRYVTVVTAREGSLEVLSPDRSVVLRAGEEAVIEGDRRASIDVGRAGLQSELERWGHRLDREAESARLAYRERGIDRSLSYSAAPLGRHGAWILVDGVRVWRPYTAADWRPYSNGRWSYTPTGYLWVSYEPWGWVPYHYGSWDFVPRHGWVWYPGDRFAPAWVYWYWGPRYVGWCPTGYYTRFYRGHHRFGHSFRFRFGVHGWAGGSLDRFEHWTFVEGNDFTERRLARRTRTSSDLRRVLPAEGLERGVITTDTRPVRPDIATRPREAMEVLQRHPTADERRGAGSTRTLPDLSSFVARRPDVSDELEEIAVPVDRRADREAPDRPSRRAVPGPTSPRSSETSSPTASRTTRPTARPAPGDDGRGADRRVPSGTVVIDRPGVDSRTPTSSSSRPAPGASGEWRREVSPRRARPTGDPADRGQLDIDTRPPLRSPTAPRRGTSRSDDRSRSTTVPSRSVRPSEGREIDTRAPVRRVIDNIRRRDRGGSVSGSTGDRSTTRRRPTTGRTRSTTSSNRPTTRRSPSTSSSNRPSPRRRSTTSRPSPRRRSSSGVSRGSSGSRGSSVRRSGSSRDSGGSSGASRGSASRSRSDPDGR